MKEILFRLENVWKTYKMMGKGIETHALRGVSVDVKKGEYVAIIGPSGSGKSTLMHVMGCLDTPNKGNVYVDGKETSVLSEDDLAKIRRRKIGFVFQSYNLIQGLTAAENVALPMRLDGVGKKEAIKRAERYLLRVGLEHRLTHKPNQMSGGEQQRVAIARSLINDPEAILGDEPTGNLDTKSGLSVIKLLEELHVKEKKTVVIVTHDSRLAARADREIHIKDGNIDQDRTNHNNSHSH
ncbi:MAG: ABC transporter ATP-binding protein [Candidatus Aenigmarchaeota archaeon]|nr:ABC transporter ATP-binding protein [Candidatus Aenigmarchaeota archaeon]